MYLWLMKLWRNECFLQVLVWLFDIAAMLMPRIATQQHTHKSNKSRHIYFIFLFYIKFHCLYELTHHFRFRPCFSKSHCESRCIYLRLTQSKGTKETNDKDNDDAFKLLRINHIKYWNGTEQKETELLCIAFYN